MYLKALGRWILCASVLGCASGAGAAPVTSLFNTGVVANDATGHPTSVVADNSPDPHYQLITVPAGDTDPIVPTQAMVTDETQFPFSGGPAVWAPDTSTSKWISPHGNDNRAEPNGIYVYQTTFSLTGFNSSSARIIGSVYADDFLTDITVNGVSTGVSGAGFVSGLPFTFASGFVPGLNTLDFFVRNDVSAPPNPSGFRIEMTGVAPTPEPSSALLAACLGGMLVRRGRRTTNRSRPL